MSMTIPLLSSVSAIKAASTTKVAPCNSCAGPNTAPRNEWAIMIWSETSTANMGGSRSTCRLGPVDIRGFPRPRHCDSRSQLDGGDLDSARAHKCTVGAYVEIGPGQEGRQGEGR